MSSSLALLSPILVCTVLLQEGPLPPPAGTPWLQLNTGSPTAAVTTLAYSTDGKALYVAGLDKVVRVYSLEGQAPQLTGTLRVPIGPGNAGAVNALAVSPNGRWLAVAGRAPMRDEAGFGYEGIVVDTNQLSPAMRRDVGVIYLVDLTNPLGGKVLRGHLAEIRAMTFAQGPEQPVLVSAAVESEVNGATLGTLRVWDVTSGREIGTKRAFPAARTRPGLVAWRSGENTSPLQVAVAWPEADARKPGMLRVWNLGDGQIRELSAGRFNNPLALEFDAKGQAAMLAAGGYSDNHGGVLLRHALLNVDPPRRITFSGGPERVHLPRAATCLAAGNLAVLVESVDPAANPPARRLALLTVSPEGQVNEGLTLDGVDFAQMPVMTASADGRHVAIAAFKDRRVEIYDVNGVVIRPESRKTIAGSRPGFQNVAVLKGEKLWLGHAGEAAERDGIVFDLRQRRVMVNPGQNELDSSPPVSMTTTQKDDRVSVTVPIAGQAVTLTLRPREQPTAVAVAPAGLAWLPQPGSIVAIAHTDPANAVTLVSLFDGQTGKRVRQYNGPLQPLRGLTFSVSRPLLAGVGEEHTAFVWSVRDLDKAVGGIEELQVTDRDGAVVVAAIEGTLTGKIPLGAVIEAVGPSPEKLVPVKSMADFLLNVRLLPVGQNAAVRLRGQGTREVPVGKAVDQRGPLFNLWLLTGADRQPTGWVGWSPAGPYDASSEEAEKFIGWHTNTGDPASPVTFAGAAQYRKNYYRHDLLRFLFDKGELASALDAHRDEYPPSPPRLRVLVHSDEGGQSGRRSLVRAPKAELEMDLEDAQAEFPLERAVLRWRAVSPHGGAGAWADVPVISSPRPWRVRLDGHAWTRGRHLFEVTLHRTPTSPPAVRSVAQADYIPLPPKVSVLVGNATLEKREWVTELDQVQIGVHLDYQGESQVELQWLEPNSETLSRQVLERQPDSTFKPVVVSLKPGATSLRVVAGPSPLKGASIEETTTINFQVLRRQPLKAEAPRIQSFGVDPAGEIERIDGRDVLIVERAEVTLRAEFQSATALTEIGWDRGDGTWVAEKPVKAQAHSLVTLKPGIETLVRVRAKTNDSEFSTSRLSVMYRPPVPRVRVDERQGSATTTWPIAWVSGTLEGEIPAKFELDAVVQDSNSGPARVYRAVVDPFRKVWWVGVPLRPGANHLSLRMATPWRRHDWPDVAVINHARLPRLLWAASTADGVFAWTLTPTDRLPMTLTINGAPDPKPAVAHLGAWMGWSLLRVHVAEPGRFQKGENVDILALAARNEEGESRPLLVHRPSSPQVPRPPRVELEGGNQARNSDQEKYTLHYRISSEHPILGVEVSTTAGGREEPAQAMAIDEATVSLYPGVNRVRVRVSNRDGITESAITISYTPRPVRIVLDGLEEVEPNGQIHRQQLAQRNSAGMVGFAPTNSGWVNLRGRVHWTSPDDPLLRRSAVFLQLAVNGVEHLPVPLEPALPGTSTRVFRAPVFLNGNENSIRLSLQSSVRTVAQEASQAAGLTLSLSCAKPLGRQRLHVVVVGVDVPAHDRFALARRVIRSLGGTIPPHLEEYFDRGEFQIPAFDQAVFYPPLVGEVIDLDVRGKLALVGREVERRARLPGSGWLNDVVLLYYQGADAQDKDGRRWLHTSQSLARDPRSLLRDALAIEELPRTPGVRLLLLNVVAEPGEPGKAQARMAESEPMLRYVWRDVQATDKLLSLLERAVSERSTWGDVAERVRSGFNADPSRGGEPLEILPSELRQRRIGGGEK